MGHKMFFMSFIHHTRSCSFLFNTLALFSLNVYHPSLVYTGKTLQSISLLAYLRQYVGVKGPHLVLVPLTTLGNWDREFARWCPDIRVFKFHGTKEERAEMIRQGMLANGQWDVLLTSYEMANREKSQIGKNKFHYIVVDEGMA
jgi:SWI/SNF-related matrix-associated actin-dependent regulator of chromatin subfamily A member 5